MLGGGGLTGRCSVRDLARGGKFERIRVADLDLALAESAVRAAGPMTEAIRVDVRDPTSLAHALEGADVCVNAVQYTFNLDVMAGRLAANVPYLDFGGLFHMTLRQLEMHDRFRSAALLAIPGLGQVPGISNVLAAEAARCHGPGRLDPPPRLAGAISRRTARSFCSPGPRGRSSTRWSSRRRSGRTACSTVPCDERSRGGPFRLSGRVYPGDRTLHSEPATLPHSLAAKGVRHVEWKEGGPGIDFSRTMALLGLASDRPVETRSVP